MKTFRDISYCKNVPSNVNVLETSPLPDLPPTREQLRMASILENQGLYKVDSVVKAKVLLRRTRNFPNQPLIHSLVRLLETGGSSNLRDYSPGKVLYDNHGSAVTHSEAIKANIEKEIKLGRLSEITEKDMISWPYFSNSPLGAVQQGLKKTRPINDKSHPRGTSHNDHIDKKDYTLGG
jgi:hypothetical protein